MWLQVWYKASKSENRSVIKLRGSYGALSGSDWDGVHASCLGGRRVPKDRLPGSFRYADQSHQHQAFEGDIGTVVLAKKWAPEVKGSNWGLTHLNILKRIPRQFRNFERQFPPSDRYLRALAILRQDLGMKLIEMAIS